MNTLELKLTGTQIEVNHWDVSVNEKNLTNILSDQLNKGKFKGNITIKIELKEEIIPEPEEE